jgi:hypothetical protein
MFRIAAYGWENGFSLASKCLPRSGWVHSRAILFNRKRRTKLRRLNLDDRCLTNVRLVLICRLPVGGCRHQAGRLRGSGNVP